MPEAPRAMAAAAATSASTSRSGAGRTCIVTSRATSDCQSLAAAATSIAVPVANAARKVIMATTALSDRPAIESLGTMAVAPRRAAPSDTRSRSAHDRATASRGSLVDMQSPLVQNQTARVVLVHQRDVVGGNDDRGAQAIQLDEQP